MADKEQVRGFSTREGIIAELRQAFLEGMSAADDAEDTEEAWVNSDANANAVSELITSMSDIPAYADPLATEHLVQEAHRIGYEKGHADGEAGRDPEP